MKPENWALGKYELDALLEALRRDMRREELLAHTDPEWAEEHRFNARKDKDILERLNPKRQRGTDAKGWPLSDGFDMPKRKIG